MNGRWKPQCSTDTVGGQRDAGPQEQQHTVRAEQDGTSQYRQYVGEEMLDRVTVQTRDADRRGPLMVKLVVVFIPQGNVKCPRQTQSKKGERERERERER